jgi:predicted TPR repeat methyltransferase
MNRGDPSSTAGDSLDPTGNERRAVGFGRLVRRLIGQAIRLHQQGALDRAIRFYRWFLGREPDNARILQLYGLALHQAGDLDGAVRIMSRSVGLNPNSAATQNNLGNALCELDRLDDALKCFARAIEADPETAANAYNNQGNVLLGLGKTAEAIESYRHVIAIDAGVAVPHFNLGNALWDSNDVEGAITCYRAAIEIDPSHAAAHNNLGNAYRARGDLAAAVQSYTLAASCDAAFVLPRFNLANTLKDLGRDAEALAGYRQVLALEPGNGLARHMAAALAGERTPAAPESFIHEVFDTYAGHFEAHLGTVLEYQVPTALREAVIGPASGYPSGGGGRARFARALDLGCGTGLVAEAFAGVVERFDGVDLSPRMLVQAPRKGLYETLEEAELVAYLQRPAGGEPVFDAVLAADAFIYIGDLEPVFAGVAGCLAAGGVFAFSIEVTEAETFELRANGRYVQSETYVRGLAQAHGFSVETIQACVILMENGVAVDGALCVLINGPASPAQRPSAVQAA